MKLGSLFSQLVEGIGHAIRRFPVATFAALIVTAAAIYSVEVKDSEDVAVPLMMCFAILAMIGIFLQIWRERNILNLLMLATGHVVSIVVLIWYYLHLHGNMVENQLSICSAFAFFGTMILLIFVIALAPYVKEKNNAAFLTYNRKVFTAYIFAFVVAFIFYIGLALAILAIDKLFQVRVDSKIYLYLLFIIGIFFFNLHFLSQYPKDFTKESPSPPEAYRIIVQYVMIPIVSIYALILIFYTVANVFHQQMIEEWTSWLMLWFYVLGFLTYLLNLSIMGDDKDDWSRAFCKWFLYLLIPLSLFSLISIGKDLSSGGVTELRYAIASFSLFLLLASVYLSFVKSKDFRFVPFVLAIIAIISIYGPWSMCKASLRSQMDRLEAILLDNNVLQNGILTTPLEIRQEDKGKVQDYIRFFADRKALDEFKKWDENNVLGDPPLEEGVIADLFDIYDITRSINVETFANYTFQEVELEGFDKLISIIPAYNNTPDSGYYLKVSEDQNRISLFLNDDELTSYTFSGSLDHKKLEEDKTIILEDAEYLIAIYPQNMQWDKDTKKVLNLEGMALFHKK